jgi:hypothetical protein
MAREARMKISTGRLPLGRIAVLVVAICGMHGARGAGPDLSGFVGAWTFQPGSQSIADCSMTGTVGPWDLTGTRISIYPGIKTGTDLTFDIGCDCAIGVNLEGSTATLSRPQACSVVNRNVQVSGDIAALTLQRSDSGVLTWTFSGAGGQLVSSAGDCSLSSYTGTGTLVRTGTETTDCGDPSTAVGVRTAFGQGGAACPLGAGQAGLWIYTHDEDNPACSDATGSRGEGPWVLPDYEGPREPVCGASHATNMDFCRVDGARFAAMTTEADPAQFYAVLKLGTTCPKGSIEVTKTIDNEDHPAADEPSRAIGALGPNEVRTGALGTYTNLTFCYFRAAATPDDVMPGFPDLGFPYAIFHRFTGDQPPWVIAKSWQHSRDEVDAVAFRSYGVAPPDVLTDFYEVIGDFGSNSTTFNMARVR